MILLQHQCPFSRGTTLALYVNSHFRKRDFMNQPLQISFKNCRPTLAIQNKLFEHIQKLERHYSPIISCRVSIEKPHRRKRHGNSYDVKIHLTAPGKDLFAGKTPNINPTHDDVYVAIRDAFDNIERQLATHFEHLRREIKSHQSDKTTGKIFRLFPKDGFGFIKTADERQIYFHENSIVNYQFDKLNMGNEVRFVEELGDQGPQASSIEFLNQ